MTKQHRSSLSFVATTVIISSFGNLAYILAMIWAYPIEMVWIVTLFTLSSNAVAFQVLLGVSPIQSSLIVLVGFLLRRLAAALFVC